MTKNSEISERITLMLSTLSLSPNSFAKKLGYERSQTIYDIINGKSAPSYDFFKRFQVSEYSETIQIDWLLTGRGEMLKSDEEKMRKTLEKSEPHLFNINLKYLREQQEWSALQVSKKLDIAWATYSAYETATWPRPETLVKISEIYNVTIDDLVKKNLQTSPKTELNNNSRIQDLTDIIKSKDEIIALQKELLQELKNKKQTKKIAGIEVEEKH
jgi:transcriptional regulator with XRE-family HTH domain